MGPLVLLLVILIPFIQKSAAIASILWFSIFRAHALHFGDVLGEKSKASVYTSTSELLSGQHNRIRWGVKSGYDSSYRSLTAQGIRKEARYVILTTL